MHLYNCVHAVCISVTLTLALALTLTLGVSLSLSLSLSAEQRTDFERDFFHNDYGRHRLLALYRAHDGLLSDKWANFVHTYDEVLRPFLLSAVEREMRRERKSSAQVSTDRSTEIDTEIDTDLDKEDSELRLLELGIQNGGSLQLLHKYFLGLAHITAVDIDPLVLQHIPGVPDIKERIEQHKLRIIIGNASEVETVHQVLNSDRSPGFQIIIDDASHISTEVVTSFELLFPHVLPGGIYVVEDAHASYIRKRFLGGYGEPHTTMTYFKYLVNVINNQYPREAYADDIVQYVHMWVRSIEFHEGMIIVRKLREPKTGRYCRVIVGSTEPVTKLKSLVVDGLDIMCLDNVIRL